VKIVCGLGNPGSEYAHTRHNAGFEATDRLAERLGYRLRRSFRFRARMCRAEHDETAIWIVQPLTYMNLSGPTVAAIMRAKGCGASDLIAVFDDADLPVGKLRIRRRGSSGGHKGLGSLIEALGTDDFARIRIGIGRENSGGDLVEHVLSRWSAEEWELVSPVIEKAVEAALCIVESGVEAAMNRFNG